MVLQPEDCEFTTQAIRNYIMAGITVFLFASTLVLRSVVARICNQLELTEEAKKHGETIETFPLRVTLNFVGFCFHSILGPYAVYHSLLHINDDVAASITVASGVASPSACSFCWHSGVAGTVFSGYAIFQTLQLIPVIGWEVINGENVVHHLCFTVIGVVQCNYYFGAEIVCAAVAMEASTPALLALLTFRQLHGYEKATFYSKTIFAVLFLVFRVLLFGLADWHFLGLWLNRVDVIDKFVFIYVPKVVFFVIQVLYFAGWCLQAFWAVTLLMKALRPHHEKPSQIGQE